MNLQGKNYIFTLAPTFYPIAEAGCTAAASKTRKNIIITLQVSLFFHALDNASMCVYVAVALSWLQLRTLRRHLTASSQPGKHLMLEQCRVVLVITRKQCTS